MDKKTVRDIDVSGKTVLVRVDFNVPLRDGVVTDDSRIRAALPTIEYLTGRGAKVILMSHLGRPKGVDDALRLDAVAQGLADILGKQVEKADTTVGDDVKEAIDRLEPGGILLLENLRFNEGEKKNDPEFASQLGQLADVYVNDAFGASHRAHASIVGLSKHMPAVAGLLLEKEIDTLAAILKDPDRPLIAILGGSKVSDKIGVIEKFLDIVNALLIGGGMCFTFLKAKGFDIGNSLLEEDKLDFCRRIIEQAAQKDIPIYLPSDVVIAQEISPDAEARIAHVDSIPDGWMGLDIGPDSIAVYRGVIGNSRTLFWNGPMGVFEIEQFSRGTEEVAKAIAASVATSIIGGGDSIAALKKFHLEDKVTFVSTGGGASLELLEGKVLPGYEALMDK
ncbi:MAG: phosphoglycerate kinase [Candidatus Aquicultor primus]|uniref:Phosphoglycerate kinase n=1 Tax=Candidatus Aquicultor primus TaxID=1797195 RepID=A0A1F2UL02_9ACTN|nr:MAG: phosphoglycerate kinase [Candidatus Aquicultor primus]